MPTDYDLGFMYSILHDRRGPYESCPTKEQQIYKMTAWGGGGELIVSFKGKLTYRFCWGLFFSRPALFHIVGKLNRSFKVANL
jgi:hypothetical protein